MAAAAERKRIQIERAAAMANTKKKVPAIIAGNNGTQKKTSTQKKPASHESRSKTKSRIKAGQTVACSSLPPKTGITRKFPQSLKSKKLTNAIEPRYTDRTNKNAGLSRAHVSNANKLTRQVSFGQYRHLHNHFSANNH